MVVVSRLGWMKRIMAVLLAVVMLGLVFGDVAYAYTVTTSGTTTFNTEKQNFVNAQSPVYINQSESISGKIAQKYQQHIYHYKAPTAGYYAFYTTGSLDTVGALYEENSFLFFDYWFDYVTHNDDYFGSADRRFYYVAELDKNEDYYPCVRAHGTKTGSFTLKIEPNEDKIWHKNYGVWKSNKLPASASASGVWTSKKVYLNKEQVLLYYWSLDPATTVDTNGTTVQQLVQKFKSNNTTGFNLFVNAIATAMGLASGSAGVSLTITLLSFILTEGVAYLSSNGMTEYKMMQKLVQLCGVKHNPYASKPWTVQKGLLATYTFTGYPVALIDPWSYSAYIPGSTTLKGEKWYVGTWTF